MLLIVLFLFISTSEKVSQMLCSNCFYPSFNLLCLYLKLSFEASQKETLFNLTILKHHLDKKLEMYNFFIYLIAQNDF